MNSSDTCLIQPSLSLSNDQLNSLMLVYTPSMGSFAVSVYLMMIAFSQHKKSVFYMRELLDFLNCTLDQFEKALNKNEQFQLCSTYTKKQEDKNMYAFVCKAPLSIHDFIHHDVFGRYLMKVLDKSYLVQLKEANTVQSLTHFNDITASFDGSLLEYWEYDKESMYQNNKKENKEHFPSTLAFDMKLFLKSTPELLFPNIARTKENIEAIEYFGSLYGIDVITMKSFVGKCTKINDKTLNKQKLEHLILTHINNHKTSTKSEYTQDSYMFFSSKQKGKALGVRDKKTIAFLYEHYMFSQEVQNRLIDYVLTRFNGSFTKNLVQQIADSWLRANIQSEADVKKHLSKQSASSNVELQTPAYMKETTTKKTTAHDKDKRQELLDKLKKGE